MSMSMTGCEVLHVRASWFGTLSCVHVRSDNIAIAASVAMERKVLFTPINENEESATFLQSLEAIRNEWQ